ncbi:MAG: hypothetical protein ABIW57_05465 [Polyangia bacterium]
MTRLLGTMRADFGLVRARRGVLRRAEALYQLGSALTLSRPTDWSRRSQRAFARLVRELSAVVPTVPSPALKGDATTARSLLRAARRPIWRLFWCSAGLLTVVAAAVLASAGVAALVSPRARRWMAPPDLALSARITTSSVFPDTPAPGTVPPHQQPFFFHTNAEDHPWITFDLPHIANVRTVRITTRTDCCRERTVPLNIEVPDGQGGWRLVCQRRVPFSSWTCDTGGVATAVVRVRLAAHDMLHLSQVQIFQ